MRKGAPVAAGRVKVPQAEGTITISVAGDEPRTWQVQEGGYVTPANHAERDLLLGTIDGAKTAPAAPKEQ